MKAVIFDYNGTLFFDSDINEIAWRQTIEELSQGSIDFDEVYPQYKSVRNYLFIEAMFKKLGKPLNEDEILWWAKRKETRYYHSYCREHHRDQLAPGAADLLDYLKEKKIPPTMTALSMTKFPCIKLLPSALAVTSPSVWSLKIPPDRSPRRSKPAAETWW